MGGMALKTRQRMYILGKIHLYTVFNLKITAYLLSFTLVEVVEVCGPDSNSLHLKYHEVYSLPQNVTMTLRIMILICEQPLMQSSIKKFNLLN